MVATASCSTLVIHINLIKYIRTTNKHVILTVSGGPGGSGFEFLWRRGEQLNKIIGEGFDLLSFDPRGVNGSIPQAVCFTSPEQREQNIFDQPWDIEFEAGEMFTRAENQIKACAEIMGEYGPYINTPQTAADMNTILDFIGQEKMYYWGFSCKLAALSLMRTNLEKMVLP